jgi:hypothetical protein
LANGRSSWNNPTQPEKIMILPIINLLLAAGVLYFALIAGNLPIG